MKKTINDHSEKLKQNIDAVSEKSKETIRKIIGSASAQFETALDANKKFIESFEKQLFNDDFKHSTFASEVKKTFANSVELSEEAIDAIIDIQSDQLRSAIDYNEKLSKLIQNIDVSDAEDRAELLETIEKNFEETSRQFIENTKKMTGIYNKHINLTVNFSERFSKNINSQLQMLNKFQNGDRDMFNNWATHWWKSTTKEEAAV